MDDEGTRKGSRAGMECGDEQKKNKVGGHTVTPIGASAQTPMSRKEGLKAKGRYKRFWHCPLSGVGVVSSCEGCCRLEDLGVF